jgi:hypothetical protein
MTVGQPGGITLPVGEGISGGGTVQAGCDVMSPTRAAGSPPINTVEDPLAISPGPAGTQVGSEQLTVVSLTLAAGLPPINTVASPLVMAKGIAGCGAGVGVGAAGCMVA